MVSVTDPDAGEDRFADPAPATLAGSYGSFAFDPLTGEWSYTLDNDLDAVQSLPEGAEVTDSLTVTSLDGTASETITVTVEGTGIRGAVGLDASWGPASAQDFIAADIDRSGDVTASDALDVLRHAVGLQAEYAPEWVFIDDDADLSGIDSGNVAYDIGIDLTTIAADTQPSMSGILLGHMGEYA